MNKITAKQLIKTNGIVTSRSEIPITEDRLKIINEIIESPYVQDEKFFYIYKTTIEKAAKLGCEIYRRKPFDEGNGKTAVLAILTLLDINGFILKDYKNDMGINLADTPKKSLHYKRYKHGITNNTVNLQYGTFSKETLNCSMCRLFC